MDRKPAKAVVMIMIAIMVITVVVTTGFLVVSRTLWLFKAMI